MKATYLDLHRTVITLKDRSQLVQLVLPDLDLIELGRLRQHGKQVCILHLWVE
jgi:hypothetical protein